MTHDGITLLDSVQCCHCWHRFAAVDVKFLSESPPLVGDPILGPDEPLRFAPSRFDSTGAAIDPGGGRCRRLACPRCHSEVPRAALEGTVSSISVVGAPGAGKSTLLAASSWSMRRLAPLLGDLFMDSEPWFNRSLHIDEAALFKSGHDGESSARMPEKTEIAGDRHYRIALVEGREETIPRPLMFTWTHREATRLIALYDNAGEHYLPQSDVHARAATRHLARSEAIIVTLDPLQDRRFVERLDEHCPQVRAARVGDGSSNRQDLVVAEFAARLRELRGIGSAASVSTPIVVAVTKADLWAAELLGDDLLEEPVLGDPGASHRRIDQDRIASLAERTRNAIGRLMPEVLSLLDSVSTSVTCLPHSALGSGPSEVGESARPRWAAIPLRRALESSLRTAS